MKTLTETTPSSLVTLAGDHIWFKAAPVSHFPKNAGACIRYNNLQIAVFNFSRRNEWYACQNLCPHKQQMILSRGMIGSAGEKPKVACPFHKRTFSLQTGECLNATEDCISIYPVHVEGGYVYVGIPASFDK
jgi:nitrite reductase (NADH) small subunit